MTHSPEISNHERRFLGLVKRWYGECLTRDVGKEPFVVVVREDQGWKGRNSEEVFRARILGIENGTLKLSAPWKNIESFGVVEVGLFGKEGFDEAIGRPRHIDLREEDNNTTNEAIGRPRHIDLREEDNNTTNEAMSEPL